MPTKNPKKAAQPPMLATAIICITAASLALATWITASSNGGIIVATGTILAAVLTRLFLPKVPMQKVPMQQSTEERTAEIHSALSSTSPPADIPDQIETNGQVKTSDSLSESDLADQREQLAHVTRLSTLGEMAASLAHEINQPLTAITTYSHACARMMKADNLDRELLLETLDKTANQALRAGEVVRRLRSFVNKRRTERLPCDAHELLDDVVRLAEVDARTHSLQLNVTMGDSLPTVVVDQIQIQQVLLNLVRNAMEATRASERFGEAIEVDVQCDGRGWLHIEVIDSGIGVNPDNIEQLFTPFFTTKTEGMGIGLSVSSSIIEAHGGKLMHRVNPTGGAIFYFALPSAEDSGAE